MKDIKDLEIKLYPLILEVHPSAGLWHLLRAIDVEGRGTVSLTMNELISFMDCSKATIYRHIKSPLFRSVKRFKSSYTFYLL